MNETDARTLVREAALNGVMLWVADGRLNFKAKKGGLSEELRAALQSKKNDLIGELSRPVFRKRDLSVGAVEFPACVRGFLDETEANASLRHATHWAVSVSGKVSLELIESAFKRLVARHDLLRSRVRTIDGVPFLVMEQDDRFAPVEIVDLSGSTMTDPSAHLRAAVERAIYAPFEDGRIYRAQIIKTSEWECAIAISIHHFVADAVSIGILVRELGVALQGAQSADSQLDERPLQYADYLLGMNEWLVGPGAKYRLEYWMNRLRGVPAICFPRTSEADNGGPSKLEVIRFFAAEELRAKLVRAVAASGVPFVVGLLAINFAALANSLQSEDIVIAFVHSGRIDPALDELVGFTANCFPVRVCISPEMSYVELMTLVHDTYALGAEYQVPLGILMDALGEVGATLVASLFNYLPVYEYLPVARARVGSSAARPKGGGFEIRPIEFEGPTPTNSADWKSHELNVVDYGVEMEVNVKYMASKYQASAVQDFADTVLRCMEALADDPTQSAWLTRRNDRGTPQ